MNKKLWIGLGAAITAVSPIVTVVACGNDAGKEDKGGSSLTKEDQAKNLNKAVADVKAFEMSTKTITEIKANALTEGKVLKESDATSNGITLPTLPEGITRKITVRRGLSEMSNTFAIDIRLSSKSANKVVSTTSMARDGGVEKIDLAKLANNKSGLINLPWEKTGEGLSLKKVIIDLSDQRTGHLGGVLSRFLGDTYKTIVDFVSMPQFKTVMKLLKSGLSSFDYKDVNDVRAIISTLLGDKYTGDVKILDALINGVKNETSTKGKLTELPKVILESFQNAVQGIIKSLSPEAANIATPLINMILNTAFKPLLNRLTGSWDNFLTNQGNKTSIDDLKYFKFYNSDEEYNLAIKGTASFYNRLFSGIKVSGIDDTNWISNYKIILKDRDNNGMKTLSSISRIMATSPFSSHPEWANFIKMEDKISKVGEKEIRFGEVNKDNYTDFPKFMKELSKYLLNNWDNIMNEEITVNGTTKKITDTLIGTNAKFKTDVGKNTKFIEDVIAMLAQQKKKIEEKVPAYDTINMKYQDQLKAAIKRNASIMNGDILSTAPISGKGILENQDKNELQKTIVYFQSVIQRLIVYLNYENQDITVQKDEADNPLDGNPIEISSGSTRNLLLKLIDPLIENIDIKKLLGSEALLKLATFDVTKPLTELTFSENDFNLLSGLFNMLISIDDASKFSGKDLQSIFTVLIDGFKPKHTATTEFKDMIAKVIKMIPGISDLLAGMLPKILFGTN